ncbi:GNAT family N-acetyltransferase [Myxococcota bacterium]|nr:GNAT family N-acetyltransferase [Myxococcota bacterium]
MASDSAPLWFPEKVPELQDAKVRLRALSERDIAPWFARATDVESAELAGDPVPASIEEGAAWLQRHRDRFRERTAIRWAITTPDAVDSIGSVGVIITSRERALAELGIVVSRAFWGRGLGTAAARLAIRYAFDTIGVRELRAEVYQRNLRSARLLENVGFQRSAGARAGAPAGHDACDDYVLRRPDVA